MGDFRPNIWVFLEFMGGSLRLYPINIAETPVEWLLIKVLWNSLVVFFVDSSIVMYHKNEYFNFPSSPGTSDFFNI